MPNDSFYKTGQWKRLRNSVVKHSGYKCSMCDKCVKGKGMARVDHIKPRKTYPHLAMERTNLRVLCVDCDAKRHREKGGAAIKPEIGADGWPVSNQRGGMVSAIRKRLRPALEPLFATTPIISATRRG